MTPSTNRTLSRTFNLLILLTLGLLVYVLASSLRTQNTTGLLTITTSDNKSLITISQNNKNAEVVGKGSAKLRLKPGVYLVRASSVGKYASVVVSVKLKKSTTSQLELGTTSAVPSADNIVFSGLDTLVDKGLSTDQSSNLRQLFFEYKESAKSIIITNVTNGSYDPSADTTTFSLLFNGTIDGSPYKAVVSYVDTTNVQLQIINPNTGAQLYFGDSTPSSPDS